MPGYIACGDQAGVFPFIAATVEGFRPCSKCQPISRDEYATLVRERFAHEHRELLGEFHRRLAAGIDDEEQRAAFYLEPLP